MGGEGELEVEYSLVRPLVYIQPEANPLLMVVEVDGWQVDGEVDQGDLLDDGVVDVVVTKVIDCFKLS